MQDLEGAGEGTYWPESVHGWEQSLHEGMLNDSILCYMPHGGF